MQGKREVRTRRGRTGGQRPRPLAFRGRTALAAGLLLLAAGLPAGAGRAPAPDRILLSLDPEGRVVLRGAVRDGEVQRRAAELAGTVEGVSGVRNELVIEPGERASELVVDSLETHEVIEPRVMELTAEPLDGEEGPGRPAVLQAAPRTTCVLSNPRFAGSCIETVRIEPWRTTVEACRGILQCLENVHCVARYCQATTIRGGWRLELVVGPEERAAVLGE